MKNFPIEHEGQTYWISRAIAVVGFIFCYDNGLRVLANKRGKGTPDFQGCWNVPCGYLDYNETTKEACCREIAEETNLYVVPQSLRLYSINDDPNSDVRQNVTFRYWDFSEFMYKGQTIYPKGAEKDEVEDVEWIGIDKINDYDWAFNHKELIIRVVLDHLAIWITTETKQKLLKILEQIDK